jgi:hypothetical protein
LSTAVFWLESRAQTGERAMESNLDGVGLQAEDPSDLFRGQVSAVAKSDQFAVALVEIR